MVETTQLAQVASCQSCHYWSAIATSSQQRQLSEREHESSNGECHAILLDASQGYCKRYPPVAVVDAKTDRQSITWPITKPADWCGEYRANEIIENDNLKPLSLRAKRVLQRLGYVVEIQPRTFKFKPNASFSNLTEDDLIYSKNCGDITIDEIRQWLKLFGLALPNRSISSRDGHAEL